MSMAQTDMVLQSLEGIEGGIDTLTDKIPGLYDGRNTRLVKYSSINEADHAATVVDLSGKGKLYAVFLVSYQDGNAILSFQIDDKVYTFKPSSSTTWKMGAGYLSMIVAPYFFTMVDNPTWAGHNSYYPQDLSSTSITRDPAYLTSVGPARFDNKLKVTYQESRHGNEGDTVFVLYELEE